MPVSTTIRKYGKDGQSLEPHGSEDTLDSLKDHICSHEPGSTLSNESIQSSTSTTSNYDGMNVPEYVKDFEEDMDNSTKQKRKREYDDEDEDEDIKPTKKNSKGRKERSLLVLTEQFKRLINQSRDGIIDLNEAAKNLQVQKRRIYDITNVLEGVELIRKFSKNRIQWSNEAPKYISAHDVDSDTQNRTELEKLSHEEKLIDDEIRKYEALVHNLIEGEYSKYAYITHEDIRKLPECINHTIIAIKAPKGTNLEVPDPDYTGDNTKVYQIYLQNNDQKPIDVYLLSQQDPQNDMPYGITESFTQSVDDYSYMEEMYSI